MSPLTWLTVIRAIKSPLKPFLRIRYPLSMAWRQVPAPRLVSVTFSPPSTEIKIVSILFTTAVGVRLSLVPLVCSTNLVLLPSCWASTFLIWRSCSSGSPP